MPLPPALPQPRRRFLRVARNVMAAAGLVAGLAGQAAPVAGEGAHLYQLVMVEQAGCSWCARWHAEIGPAYPNTDEGQQAPLRRIDLHAPRPEDVIFAAPVLLTPTFILTEDGTEAARLEGYPGDEFFWPMLDAMLSKAGATPMRDPQ